jgi:hypothetical protein
MEGTFCIHWLPKGDDARSGIPAVFVSLITTFVLSGIEERRGSFPKDSEVRIAELLLQILPLLNSDIYPSAILCYYNLCATTPILSIDYFPCMLQNAPN